MLVFGHDDGGGVVVKLGSACTTHHLQELGRRVLRVGAAHVLRRRLDHHQVRRQVHAHG